MDIAAKGGQVIYLAALLGAGILGINYFSYQAKQNAANQQFQNATEEDVVTGNHPIYQLGGFQASTSLPGPASMAAAERKSSGNRGQGPRSAATSTRTRRGRRS